jgi:hypothetical protein
VNQGQGRVRGLALNSLVFQFRSPLLRNSLRGQTGPRTAPWGANRVPPPGSPRKGSSASPPLERRRPDAFFAPLGDRLPTPIALGAGLLTPPILCRTRSARRKIDFGAEYLAYVCPCQRLTCDVTTAGA